MKLPPIDDCIEVFARGIAATRSHARPCVASRIANAWWLRDGPEVVQRRRNDEWIAPATADPAFLHQTACQRARGGFLVTVVAATSNEAASARENYARLGYRLWRTEQLMTRGMSRVPRSDPGVDIQRVATQSLASRLAKAARERMLLPEHIAPQPAPVRCHVAVTTEHLAGWVRSVSVGTSGWCASLFVEPEFRRRGIGRALVAAMLRSDRLAGLTESVLVASHAGAKLYQVMGYQPRGTVFVFTPGRRLRAQR